MSYEDVRRQALNFLDRQGSDCVGVIDCEEKFAAAILYEDLRKDGLVTGSPTKVGPEYRLTVAGRAALHQQ